MNSELPVVFGAGQVGLSLAQCLLLAGKRARIAKRTRTGVPADCEIVLGDAADAPFCMDAARGAATSITA
jgi:hypothetical protein